MMDLRDRFPSRAGLQKAGLVMALIVLCVVVFFHNLGGSALFEPDEGRNAEIAREILLTGDWVTPHYDFMARLDKPIFYYWLIAASYKIFGVSEWSARLPSAVAALACVVLTLTLAFTMLGFWQALWSGLILATGVEFFVLSRTVILDMTLTFFITLSVGAFYWGSTAERGHTKKGFHLIMYVSMAVGTLVKGPIGTILPGLVIFFYLFHTRKWILLKQMNIGLGIPVLLLIAASWYVWAETRNPGELRYFLFEENVLRFLTPRFHRSQPWYYFFSVLLVGFLPWTLLLALIIDDLRKIPFNEVTVLLVTWTVVPLFFYSFSDSKLPHYILPVYPPLAVLAAKSLCRIPRIRPENSGWELSLPWLTLAAAPAIVIIALLWPEVVPEHIRNGIQQIGTVSTPLISVVLFTLVLFALAHGIALAKKPVAQFVSYCLGFVLVFLPVQQLMATVSQTRSAKELAEKAEPFIRPGDQVIIYDVYLSSLPFYLRIGRPVLVVWSGKKEQILGSAYVRENLPRSVIDQEKVLFTHEEFSKLWKQSRDRLVVFTHTKNLQRLNERSAAPVKKILQVGDVVLLTNR
jgi:4-amino-4-deoxy-L-arabinose transferase-like glycosyltransferase